MTTPIDAAIHALRPWCSDLVRARAIIAEAIAAALAEVTAERDRARSELYAVTFGAQSWKRVAPSPRGERTGWIAPTVRVESR